MTSRPWLRGALLAFLAIGAACDRPAARTSAAPPTIARDRARLVVLLVIDQLPSWALEKYGVALDPEGFLRAGARRGVWIERVSFPYAGTYTAPGHAAIASGQPPRTSGVAGNERWDRERRATVSVVDDARHPVFGHPGAFAAPSALRAETVADLLRAETGGRARVVSLSLKDRAAVLMGGHRPDIAVWYDSTLPGFTTSSFYAEREPGWLARWRADHPVERLLVPWTAELSAPLLERLTGRDAGEGEADWQGLGATFPHDPRRGPKPATALRALPALNDDLLALADAAIEQYQLGADDVPDLLAVSISTVDYCGHAFGPDSWEYLEALVRVDRAVAGWLGRLERRRPIAVIATSDHGVTPLPERSPDPARAGRIDATALAAELEAAVAAELGPGEWIDTYEPPFVYLSSAAEQPQRRARVLAAVTAALRRRADLAWAGPVDDPDLAPGGRLPEALRKSIALSIPPGGDGDVFVVPAPYHVVTEDEPRDRGTSHGSPWPQDREVPVLFYGPGIPAGRRVSGPLAQERVAATLAALLGLDRWPGQPLPHASDR